MEIVGDYPKTQSFKNNLNSCKYMICDMIKYIVILIVVIKWMVMITYMVMIEYIIITQYMVMLK